jgi:hypothetical protein
VRYDGERPLVEPSCLNSFGGMVVLQLGPQAEALSAGAGVADASANARHLRGTIGLLDMDFAFPSRGACFALRAPHDRSRLPGTSKHKSAPPRGGLVLIWLRDGI